MLIKNDILKKWWNPFHLPPPKGPYVVGCLDLMTGYNASGCFMRLYYPTNCDHWKAQSDKWPKWFHSTEYFDGIMAARKVPKPFQKYVKYVAGQMKIPAVWEGIPRKAGTFPVVIFSHGLGACRFAYSTICLELASKGFLVASIEHRDHTACSTYYLAPDKDGKLRKHWLDFWHISRKDKRKYVLRNRQAHQRTSEVIRALNLLEDIHAGNQVDNVLDSQFDLSVFKGHLDFKSTVIMGHSFGGATTLLTLAKDHRFRVGVALDAWMYPIKRVQDLPDRLSQPILFINMERFQKSHNLEGMVRFLVNTRVERRIVTVRHSNHEDQSDTTFFVGWPFGAFVGRQWIIPPQVIMGINNRLIWKFLSKHMGNSTEDRYDRYLEKWSKIILEGLPSKEQKMVVPLVS